MTLPQDQPTDRHRCFQPAGYCEAIDGCDENDRGEFWVGNGEYSSRVNFCPVCGAKAPAQIDPTSNKEPPS
jgi:hypothetical protein